MILCSPSSSPQLLTVLLLILLLPIILHHHLLCLLLLLHLHPSSSSTKYKFKTITFLVPSDLTVVGPDEIDPAHFGRFEPPLGIDPLLFSRMLPAQLVRDISSVQASRVGGWVGGGYQPLSRDRGSPLMKSLSTFSSTYTLSSAVLLHREHFSLRLFSRCSLVHLVQPPLMRSDPG